MPSLSSLLEPGLLLLAAAGFFALHCYIRGLERL